MAEPDDQRERQEDEEEPPVAPPSRGADQAVWVGFFLVVGIIAIFAALFILTDAALFRGRYIVSTVVTDAGGIRRGDPVQMRGVNIGRVQRYRVPESVHRLGRPLRRRPVSQRDRQSGTTVAHRATSGRRRSGRPRAISRLAR